jgi:2'-5' RNA ligase
VTAHAPPGGQARLFLALWPTPAVRAGLLAWRDAFAWPAHAAPVGAAELHLTLHFIGAVPRAALDALLPRFAAPVPAFELRFGRPELWPGGLAVLVPHAVPDALLALHATLRAALEGAALRTETRPFRPHVTLARRAHGVRLVEPAPPVRWRVRGHVLVESRSGPAGRYVVLRHYR